MPNGDPNWRKNELPKLRAFFRKISKVLKHFARTHNLKIDKYYHQGPAWTFRFRHPKGGVGQIFVRKSDEEHVLVAVDWFIDDYDKLTRYDKHTELQKCSLDHTALRTFLEEMLKTMLSWRKEDLTPFKSKYHCWQREMTKEEFEKKVEKYPISKLH
jgi:hypothetical protein